MFPGIRYKLRKDCSLLKKGLDNEKNNPRTMHVLIYIQIYSCT